MDIEAHIAEYEFNIEWWMDRVEEDPKHWRIFEERFSWLLYWIDMERMVNEHFELWDINETVDKIFRVEFDEPLIYLKNGG